MLSWKYSVAYMTDICEVMDKKMYVCKLGEEVVFKLVKRRIPIRMGGLTDGQ